MPSPGDHRCCGFSTLNRAGYTELPASVGKSLGVDAFSLSSRGAKVPNDLSSRSVSHCEYVVASSESMRVPARDQKLVGNMGPDSGKLQQGRVDLGDQFTEPGIDLSMSDVCC